MRLLPCRSVAAAFSMSMLAACALPTDRAGAGDAPAAQDDALVGGTAAAIRDFPSVFIWTDGPDVTVSYCTAARIGVRLFLTAGHCVLDQDDVPGRWYVGQWRTRTAAGGDARYSFSRYVSGTTRQPTMPITAVHLPPQLAACLADPAHPGPACATGRTPLPDVAVVEVAAATGEFARARIARLDYRRVTAGAAITLVGYGMYTDNDTSNPKLRYASTQVADAASLATALVGTEADVDGAPDWAHFFGTLGALSTPARPNLGNGDSGGPVFLTGTSSIVGVNSDAYCPLSDRTCQLASNSEFARLDKGAAHGVGEWLDALVP